MRFAATKTQVNRRGDVIQFIPILPLEKNEFLLRIILEEYASYASDVFRLAFRVSFARHTQETDNNDWDIFVVFHEFFQKFS